MNLDVDNAKPIGPPIIQVQFKPAHLTGVFESLKDPEISNQVHIEHRAMV